MAISLRLIGELQYGFGIALLLLTVVGSLIVYNHEMDTFRDSQESYMAFHTQLSQYEGESLGLTDKERYELLTTRIFSLHPFDILNARLAVMMNVILTLGLFSLSVFLILQGIANIKTERYFQHLSKKELPHKHLHLHKEEGIHMALFILFFLLGLFAAFQLADLPGLWWTILVLSWLAFIFFAGCFLQRLKKEGRWGKKPQGKK